MTTTRTMNKAMSDTIVAVAGIAGIVIMVVVAMILVR